MGVLWLDGLMFAAKACGFCMLKFCLVILAVLAVWVFFTEPGQRFYDERFGVGRVEVQAPVPEMKEIRQLEEMIRVKNERIGVLQREMEGELKVRSQSGNQAFRTDPMFLERGIKRLEDERDLMVREVERLKAQVEARSVGR